MANADGYVDHRTHHRTTTPPADPHPTADDLAILLLRAKPGELRGAVGDVVARAGPRLAGDEVENITDAVVAHPAYRALRSAFDNLAEFTGAQVHDRVTDVVQVAVEHVEHRLAGRA